MVENSGTTSCEFKKDKVYGYAATHEKSNKYKRKYLGFLPSTYEKLEFTSVLDKQSNVTSILISLIYLPSSNSHTGNIDTIQCRLILKPGGNLKKVGTALYSLGIKPKTYN